MFTNLPPVTKALLIANCGVFVLQLLLGPALDALMLWPWLPPEVAPYAPHGFMPWQLLTHGFMHSPSNIAHLLFNMLALLMFGAQLEYAWGQKRFLTYFLVCVVGAGLCQLLVVSWSVRNGGGYYPTVGASGGVFGLLLAYGMLFPNQRVMLLIPPVPMKARTLVIVYGLIELVLGITGTQSGVAHFAHLGGMLFGWLLIRHWRGQPPFGGRRVRRVV
ncbi:rhomboid family intramembrane serine protease [Luteimonas sp. M1R5S18]|jgi:membrane associated rhomboid family serine protease|uniref:Rhomboid family intramembrane serine protease n=1 Tax=Luteimonas rhizosphaericola TaxID=3042024 RepID=A0ABT6JMY5_9GAMM|nr:rhomboid family intramembrane serine protease [Luteimonas rhizosphaericola]MDH5832027.1 rhomboid family intramembrane serine protease [Luteimonas rhizosphaericola]